MNERPPSVGPVTAELFNILDGWGLDKLDWNSAPYLDRLARAMHVAFRDRLDLLGDPDFVDVPLDEIVSRGRAAEWRDRIDQGTDLDPSPQIRRAPAQETTHVTAVDSDGNGAAITHSIGCSSGVVTPGLGFLHNSHMEMFDPTPDSRHSIAPGKRGLSGGGPVLFLEEGQLRILIGSPGGARKVSSIVQAVLNMEYFGMKVDQAVAVDRIHAENEPRLLIVEPHFPPETLLELAHLGQHIRFEWYTGRLAAVSRDHDGVLQGGTDPRGGRGIAVA
jgi:gamma-glutamyltranspeptidase/glutathione hydrolase